MSNYVLALPFVVIGMIVASAPIILGMRADDRPATTDTKNTDELVSEDEELALVA